MAARPKRIGNGDAKGVPTRGEGLMGVIGVRGVTMLNRPFVTDDPPLDGVIRDDRRCGVESEEVERVRDEIVRVRGGSGLILLWLVETGDCAVKAGAMMGSVPPSCHCKWMITDLVAH